MSYPTVFANLPGSPSTNPASLIDTMFNIVGGMGAIPCTATGTNAITLTPNTNYYLPAAYANFQMVGFTAAANATGSVTIRIGALAFVNLYMPSGLQAGSGDITSGTFYIAAFNAALNTGSGGFQVFNASTPSVIQPVQGTFKNLTVANGGTPDTQIAVTADQVMLQNNAGGAAKVSTVSVTISMVASGANGLDSGTVSAATWYYIYVIYNGSTIAGLASTSATSPTLPAGYTYFARVSAIRTGGASTNLTRILQKGRRAQYVVTAASQTPNLPNITNGTAGTYSDTAPAWSTQSISNFVPTTAGSIIASITTDYNNQAQAAVLLAPNTSYTGIFTTNPPPYGRKGTGAQFVDTIEMVLEGSVVAWVSSAAGGGLFALGWTDNL